MRLVEQSEIIRVRKERKKIGKYLIGMNKR